MSDWRPFEPSRESVKAASEYNRCNRHDDCASATAEYMARKKLKHTWEMPAGFHCHSDDCEECFGS